MQVSQDSCETFVHANVAQFYFLAIKSRNVLFVSQFVCIVIAFVSHIRRIVQLTETTLRWVCEGLATHAMTLGLFCKDFCRIEFLECSKFSRPVRDCCEDFANSCEHFITVKRLGRELNGKTVTNCCIPVR